MKRLLAPSRLGKFFNHRRFGKRCLLAGAVAALLSVGNSTTYAQSIFDNPIEGTNPNTANPYIDGQTFDPNITVSGIGRGTGNLGTNANNRYTANSWDTLAFDPTAYFEWTLTPNATFEIDFVSLVYNAQKSATGPQSFALRSSVDAFAGDIFTTTLGATAQTVPYNVSLTAASFQNVTSGITFRLFAWGATGSGGTFSVNDFTFNGVVGPAGTFTYNYWDPNGNTAGIGGAGIWSAAGTNWASDNTGTSTSTQTLTSPGLFEGTGGAVTVSGIVAPALGFKVNSNGYTFSGGTEITLAGANTASNTIEVATGVSTDISTVLGGTSGMTKAGPGTLTLSAANTFTGTLDVTGGSLILGVDDAVADGVEVKVVGTYDINTRNDTVGPVTLTSGAITGTTGTLTATGYTASAGTISANLAGSGATFVKTGTGTVTVSGNNSFDGAVTIADGTLSVASPNALGNSPSSSISFLGGTLQFSAGNTVDYSPRFANGFVETVRIDTNGQNVTFASPLTSSGGSLIKSGEGRLTLSGNNSYDTGTTINAGTIKATTNTALGTADVTMNNQTTLHASAGTTVPNNIIVSATPVGNILAGWDFSPIVGGADSFGVSPYAATTTDAGITTSGLVRGAGMSTTGGTGASNAWGGKSFLASTDAATGIAADRFATVTISSTNLVNLTEISAYNVRRSGSGPNKGQWQYQVESGAFVDIGSPIEWGAVTSSAGNAQSAIDLTAISALQGLPANTNVTFRVIPFDATGDTGTWYLNDPSDTTALDFVIRGAYGAIVPSGPTIGTDEAGSATFTGTITANGFTTLTAVTGGTANFQGVITGSGTIAKSGPGIVTMSADNNYTGKTLINEGTLSLVTAGTNNIPNSNEIRLSSGTLDVSAVSGAGGFALATGQVLSGAGTVTGSLTAATSTEVRPGGSNVAGTLNFGPLTLSGAGLSFDLGTTSDLIDLGAALLTGTGTNTFTLNNLAGFGAGSYTLIDYGTLDGGTSLSNFALSSPTLAGFNLSLVDNGSAIVLNVVSTGGPTVWQGADNDNWTAAGSWSGSVPNSPSAEAKFVTTGGTTAILDANQTVNMLTFDATAPHTISGANTLTLAGTTPTISTAGTNTATQTVAVNLDLAAGTSVSVQGGTLELNSPANAVLGAGVTATVASGATLSLGGAGNALSNGTSTHANVANSGTLAATTAGKRVGEISGSGTTTVTATGATLTANHIRQATLNIGAGNTVTVATNGGDSGTSVVSTLSINATGKLDLNDNDLVVDNGNLATLTAQLASGLDINGSYGNGPGITSSAFANNVDFNTVLGIAANSELGYTSFSGQTVDANDVLIKYTYYGDADLSGSVDTSTDFDLYITGLTSGGSLGGWLFGDFDYSGTVDSSTDFDLYITGLTSQGSPLLTAGGGGNLVQAVPEPSTFVLGGLALLGFAGVGLRRRRMAK